MSTLKEKLEQLVKEKEQLVAQLKELDSTYKTGIRNLDRIEGAIFILKDTIEGEKSEEKSTDTTTQNTETIEAESVKTDK